MKRLYAILFILLLTQMAFAFGTSTVADSGVAFWENKSSTVTINNESIVNDTTVFPSTDYVRINGNYLAFTQGVQVATVNISDTSGDTEQYTLALEMIVPPSVTLQSTTPDTVTKFDYYLCDFRVVLTGGTLAVVITRDSDGYELISQVVNVSDSYNYIVSASEVGGTSGDFTITVTDAYGVTDNATFTLYYVNPAMQTVISGSNLTAETYTAIPPEVQYIRLDSWDFLSYDTNIFTVNVTDDDDSPDTELFYIVAWSNEVDTSAPTPSGSSSEGGLIQILSNNYYFRNIMRRMRLK